MVNDPKKAEHLKYLILWVTDWHKDSLSLRDAMRRLSTGARTTATRPRIDVPDPPPPPEMSPSPEDYEWCDVYFQAIAYNNYATALGVLHLSPDPNGRDIAGSLGYDDVNSLDACNEWMRLTSGLFKSMIRFYPIQNPPDPLPQAPQPAPDDDEGKFWSKMKVELQSLAQDAVNFVNDHFSGKAMKMPQPGRAAVPSKSQCILSIEKSTHQIFMDYCRISNHLPDHFPPPGPGRIRIMTK
jgi:hypothetical protein